jgi:hypothetical protein
MNDTTPKTSAFATWLPLVSLAFSAAAFSLGAPARLARSIRPTIPASFEAGLENALRDEPSLFPMPVQARLPRTNAPIFLRR